MEFYNYKVKRLTPVLTVKNGEIVNKPGDVYIPEGKIITAGYDTYLMTKQGNSVSDLRHVLVIGDNTYIPYVDVLRMEVVNPPKEKSSPRISSVEGGKYMEVSQPNIDPSISMMVGSIGSLHESNQMHRNKGRHSGITGEKWNEKIKERVFFNADGDKVTVEVTEDQLKDEYGKSGSKKSFKDWLKSTGKDTLLALSNLAAALIAKRGNSGGSNGVVPLTDEEKKHTGGGTTILGMHPVTFGILALSAIGVIAFFAFRGRGAAAPTK